MVALETQTGAARLLALRCVSSGRPAALTNCYRATYFDGIAINLRDDAIMAAVTIRNLSEVSEEAHRALKVRAARHNRSTEAEMRAILEAAVRPEGRLRLGTALADMSRKIGLTNADIEALDQVRNTKSAEPLRF